MKKYIIIASLAVGALAYGQIQVQSSVQSTISKQNPFLDASNYSNGFKNNEGKGLYFPTTDLTKWEFKTDLINPGNFPTYFDGMIVYNTGEGEPTTDANVGGKRSNLTRGFYYFKNPDQTFPDGSVENGEWIRLNDSFANEQLWVYNPTTKSTELAKSTIDEVAYLKMGGFRHLPRQMRKIAIYDRSANTYSDQPFNINQTNFNNSYNLNATYSDLIRGDYMGDPYPSKILNSNLLLIDNNESSNIKRFYSNNNVVKTNAESTNNYNAVYSSVNFAENYGKGDVVSLIGTYNNALHLGTGSVDGVYGAYNQATAYSSNYISKLNATYSYLSPRGSGNINFAIATRGLIALGSDTGDNTNTINYLAGTHNHLKIEPTFNGEVERYVSFGTSLEKEESTNAHIKNMYGVKLADVNLGSEKNYAIYTGLGKSSLGDVFEIRNDKWETNQEAIFQFKNGKFKNVPTSQIVDQMHGLGSGGSDLIFKTQSESTNNPNQELPTEKMTIYANGNVKINNLSGVGERLVIASEQGVLSTSTVSVDEFASLWANDTANNLVKLKNLADGTTARTDSGDERNSVTISNEGIFTAKGYRGYNGANLFPDYVFENYYNGTSTTKAEYSFKNLNEVENFVKANGHLPGYQSAKEVKAQGYIDIMETQLTNVEKIEELYLHLIEKEKEVQSLKTELATQKERLDKLEKLLVQ